MRGGGFKLDQNQYVQLLHLCAGAGEEHWPTGGKLMKELLEGEKMPELTEPMASGCIKLYDCLHQPEDAVQMWQRMRMLDLPRKRRTFAPLLALLSDGKRLQTALDVFKDSQTQGVDLLEEDFMNLAKACAAQSDAEQLASVLQAMMELIYTLKPTTLAEIEAIFTNKNVETATVQISAEDGKGLCPHCGETLRSIDLSPEELVEMCGQICTLAKVGDFQSQAFEAFKQWLLRRDPPDAVVDGANVGYYSLRPDQGETLNYQKVAEVVRWFVTRGKRPLLVMHSRHFGASAPMSSQDRQQVQRWKDDKILYATPPKMNDDWFWLYAAVWGSSVAGAGKEVVMVSNDQMRDHHFQMLSARKFLKWRERHWVNFHFADRARGPPILAFPSKFSIRMQHVEGDPKRWHFPHAESGTTWLCCAKNSTSEAKPET